jgi:hypothetical protein
MDIVNTRRQIGVGLKFGLEEVPERNDMEVTTGMRRLCDGKTENGMRGLVGRMGEIRNVCSILGRQL